MLNTRRTELALFGVATAFALLFAVGALEAFAPLSDGGLAGFAVIDLEQRTDLWLALPPRWALLTGWLLCGAATALLASASRGLVRWLALLASAGLGVAAVMTLNAADPPTVRVVQHMARATLFAALSVMALRRRASTVGGVAGAWVAVEVLLAWVLGGDPAPPFGVIVVLALADAALIVVACYLARLSRARRAEPPAVSVLPGARWPIAAFGLAGFRVGMGLKFLVGISVGLAWVAWYLPGLRPSMETLAVLSAAAAVASGALIAGLIGGSRAPRGGGPFAVAAWGFGLMLALELAIIVVALLLAGPGVDHPFLPDPGHNRIEALHTLSMLMPITSTLNWSMMVLVLVGAARMGGLVGDAGMTRAAWRAGVELAVGLSLTAVAWWLRSDRAIDLDLTVLIVTLGCAIAVWGMISCVLLFDRLGSSLRRGIAAGQTAEVFG